MEIIEGPKLFIIVGLLCIALLLSSLESTIVSTALISIASDLDNYGQSNWIVIAYLLTYSSFLIVFARLSDITGRKPALLTSLTIFTIASLACGLARTLLQLIIFRVFQGIGGSGIYALTMVLVAEIAPRRHFGAVYGIINMVFVTASAIGPVIGGAITTFSTWRWAFFLNVPAGSCVIALLAFLFPGTESEARITLAESLRRVDWLGLILCLGASVVIIVPLQEGGSGFSWNSTLVIAMIAIGGLCWIVFAGWEVFISRRPAESALLPMVPNRVAYQRVVGFCILNAFLTGIAFSSTVIYLPQRFQAVNGLSAVEAGIRLLPVLVISALASVGTGFILSKRNVCSYFIIAGTALQVLGLGLHSSLSTTASVPVAAYGYQVILGLGLGPALISTFVLARIEVRREDIAPTVGTITQVRVFGGVIGLVICRVVQQSYLRHHLPQIINDATENFIVSMAAINKLDSETAAKVRQTYGESSNMQWRILTFIAAANLVTAFFTWRKHAKPIPSNPSTAETDPEAARVAEADAVSGRTDVALTTLQVPQDQKGT